MQASATSQKIVNELEKIVKKARGKVSPADVASETGYSLTEVQDGLARLIELYHARVGLDYETGKLQFTFNYPLEQRGKKSFKEIMVVGMEYFWKGFKIFYKALTGIILVAYTVIFVLILLAAMMSQRDNNRNDQIPRLIGGIFQGLFQAFYFVALTRSFNYAYDSHGYRYKQYKTEENKGKNFIMSVFNFVFGPERPKYDPLSDAKEAAAFIRQNNGKLTAGHIVALTGVDYMEAEARLAEYTVRFNGELTVNDDGIVVAEFHQMLNKISDELKGGKIEYYMDEVEAPYELTGNQSGRNTIIVIMNSFNLLMSAMIMGAETTPLILGLIPFLFSISFFLIPIGRMFYVNSKNKKRQYNIIHKALVGAFISNPAKQVPLNYLVEKAKLSKEEAKQAQNVLKDLVIELQGELNIDSDGTPLYSFQRLAKELKY